MRIYIKAAQQFATGLGLRASCQHAAEEALSGGRRVMRIGYRVRVAAGDGRRSAQTSSNIPRQSDSQLEPIHEYRVRGDEKKKKVLLGQEEVNRQWWHRICPVETRPFILLAGGGINKLSF
jgi:hypothetical protein